MKIKILISILILSAATLASHANAATDAGSTAQTAKSKSVVTKASKAAAKAKAKAANNNPNAKLSTDISFDGQVVGGKTQSPFESMAVVENEKSIDDLIGVRTSFTDRSKKAQGMR